MIILLCDYAIDYFYKTPTVQNLINTITNNCFVIIITITARITWIKFCQKNGSLVRRPWPTSTFIEIELPQSRIPFDFLARILTADPSQYTVTSQYVFMFCWGNLHIILIKYMYSKQASSDKTNRLTLTQRAPPQTYTFIAEYNHNNTTTTIIMVMMIIITMDETITWCDTRVVKRLFWGVESDWTWMADCDLVCVYKIRKWKNRQGYLNRPIDKRLCAL